MKKIRLGILLSGLLMITFAEAQTIQEGMNHLYAERYQSAKSTFEKLLSVNPNNIDAAYWLGQVYLEMDDVAGARQVYQKALLTSANAPLLMVGMAHVELRENKTADARTHFEAALTMTRTKKGDDPVILNAVGRANIDAKAGDLAYAIEKLKAAADRDPKNADIFLNLGNAYRKARPGEGGGDAYTNYKKALEVNPNFAIAYYRIAKLFETQQNWDLFVENLNDAVSKDPTFAPAYYDLYYYYLLKIDPATGKIDFGKADEYAKKFIANADPDVQNEYLRAQTLWAQKNYNEAISVAQSIISKAGAKTNPRVYRVLAYSYVEKGDTLQAKNAIDQFFAKAKTEEIVIPDYILKANIYSGIQGNNDLVVKAILDAVKADTLLENKIDWLKRGADLMKTKADRKREADFREMIYKMRPNPTRTDLFNWGLALYFDSAYVKADSVFGIYSTKYPDEIFGWQWQFNSERQIDTSMQQGLAVPTALKFLDVLQKDTLKNKPTILTTAGYLAQYYANIAKDKEKALQYLKLMQQFDPNNEVINDAIKKMEKPVKQSTNPRNNTPTKSNGKTSKKKDSFPAEKYLVKK